MRATLALLSLCQLAAGVRLYNAAKRQMIDIVEMIPQNKPLPADMPHFFEKDMKGQTLDNQKYEEEEQAEMWLHTQKGYKYIQLGGNVGTSCIMGDKIMQKFEEELKKRGDKLYNSGKPGYPNRKVQYCVEPVNAIKARLEQNQKDNGAMFTILNGIVGKDCSQVKIKDCPPEDANNCWGESTTTGPAKADVKYQKVNCIDMDKMTADYKPNALFADCEGCMCSFLKDYPKFCPVAAIYEPDNVKSDKNPNGCDYGVVEAHLKNCGLTKRSDNRGPNVLVWDKAGTPVNKWLR